MKVMKPEHVKYIVIHCSATSAKHDIGVADIDRWHRQKGYFMVGYHYVIKRNGHVQNGRPLTRFGAHAYGYNQQSLGICLAGGVDRNVKGRKPIAVNNFTPNQFAALRLLLGQLGKIGYGHAAVLGHRDMEEMRGTRLKDCPSFDVREWLSE